MFFVTIQFFQTRAYYDAYGTIPIVGVLFLIYGVYRRIQEEKILFGLDEKSINQSTRG